MTRSQIARVLREAAMIAHDLRKANPYFCMYLASVDLYGDVYTAENAFALLFRVYDFFAATNDETVLALLFAAEAVESE